MINRLKYLITHKTIQNISLVTLGNFFNAGLGFVALIIVSRALGPSEFGVFSVIFGFFTLLSKFGDLGSNATLMKYVALYTQKRKLKHRNNIIGFGLGLTYLFILLTLLFITPFYRQIAGFLNIAEYSNYILLAILLSFGVVLFNTHNVILQALEKFNYFLYSYTTSSILKIVLIALLLTFYNLNLFNSLLVYFLAPIIGFMFGSILMSNTVASKIKPNLDKKVLLSITPFLYFMAAANIFGAISEQLGVFLSSILFSEYETGLYSAASKLSMVFTLIAGSVGTVLIARASRYQDIGNIKKFTKKSLFLGLFLFVFIIPIIVFPDFFIKVTSGEEYLVASPLLVFISIAGGLTLIRSSFSSVFYSLEKAEYFAIMSGTSMVLEGFLMYYLGSNFGIIGLVYSKLLVSIILIIISLSYYLTSVSKLSKLRN